MALRYATTDIPKLDFAPDRKDRLPIHPAIRFEIRIRDGHCTHVDQNGTRCTSRKDLEIHHIIEVAHGGTDNLENLTLLCRQHHQAQHPEYNFEKRPAYRSWVREDFVPYQSKKTSKD